MPGVSGLEVARAAGPRCQVIFITAYEEYALRAFDEGAVDYLQKPVARERLSRAIESARARGWAAGAPSTWPRCSTSCRRSWRRPTGHQVDHGQCRRCGEDVLRSTRCCSSRRRTSTRASSRPTAKATSARRSRNCCRRWIPRRSGRCIAARSCASARSSAVEKLEDGKLHLRVRGQPEVLPVSSAFSHRFRGM